MGKGFRRSLIRLRRIFPDGVKYGLAFFFCAYIVSLLWTSGFSVMGVSKSEVARLVLTSFWPWVLFAQAKILLCYLIVGYAVGISAELVAENLFSQVPFARALWILAANGYFFFNNVKKYPQLYTEALYDRGGLFRYVQLLATDWLPQTFFNGAGAVLACFLAFSFAVYIAKSFSTRIYLLAFITAVASCFAGYGAIRKNLPVKNTGPNIMIIAADSFRNDRLGCHAYSRDVTPNIDKIAAEGTVFNKAYTVFPRTFPSVISMLTGQLPVTHKVRHMFPDKYVRDHRAASIVEALRKNGYATAVISDFAGDVFSRMRIGFEQVKAPYFNFITLINQRCLESHFLLLPYVTNPVGRAVFPELKEFANNGDPFMLADETIDTLQSLTRKDKFFGFVFFSNIHFPYASPYPYYQKYTSPDYKGRFKYHKPPSLYSQEKITDEDITQIHALYDGSVKAFDDSVGMIIDYLKKRGCYDNTIIIITADHGENLYENGWYTGHGEHLRGDKVLNIPLIIRFPRKEYIRKVDCVVRNIDLAPTLFDYLGIKHPVAVDGESLMPLVEGKKVDLGLLAFAETGIWFSDVSDGFFQKERIMYPDITGISKIDYTYNLEVVLKSEYESLINTAKHRMIDDGRYRLIYVPLREGIKYELYDNGVEISVEGSRKAEELKNKLFGFMKKDENIVFKNGFAVPAK